MRRLPLLLLLAAGLAACAQIDAAKDSGLALTARAVDGYCRLDEADRARLREAINRRTEEFDVEWTCAAKQAGGDSGGPK